MAVRYKKNVILLVCMVFLFAGGLWGFSSVGDRLSLSEEPRRSDIVICLNAGDARVQKAVELYRQGYADKILVTYVNTREKVIKRGVRKQDVLESSGWI